MVNMSNRKPNHLNGSNQKSQDRKENAKRNVRFCLPLQWRGALSESGTVNKEYYLKICVKQ